MSESPGGLVRHLWLAASSEHPIGWARGGTGDAASHEFPGKADVAGGRTVLRDPQL